MLDGPGDLLGAVREHLARVESSLSQTRRLRARLSGLLERLEREPGPTLEDFLSTIEEMTMVEHYYTEDQLAQLASRREQWGEERLRQAERDWAQLVADVRAERERGTAPDRCLASARSPSAGAR